MSNTHLLFPYDKCTYFENESNSFDFDNFFFIYILQSIFFFSHSSLSETQMMNYMNFISEFCRFRIGI